MSRHSGEREARQLAEQAGLKLLSIASGGRHLKARLERPDGSQEVVVFPCTASDWRAAAKKLSELRRIARGMPAGQFQSLNQRLHK